VKAVIQRVKRAEVIIDNSTYNSINVGLLVFIGIGLKDDFFDIKKVTKKILNLRIFEDVDKKMNLSLKDIQGEVLIISQFTLHAECKKGNRPSFVKSAPAIDAQKIYNEFVNYIKDEYHNIKTGKFGASMEVDLINSGPITIQLDSKRL